MQYCDTQHFSKIFILVFGLSFGEDVQYLVFGLAIKISFSSIDISDEIILREQYDLSGYDGHDSSVLHEKWEVANEETYSDGHDSSALHEK